MRLWHQSLISKLPRQQLLGQHRECCALRGKGWGKKHSVVDYVFKYSPEKLVAYHMMVMFEMKKRGYKPDPIWENCNYRGKILGEEDFWCDPASVNVLFKYSYENLYSEHNNAYLKECIDNLAAKGIKIEE